MKKIIALSVFLIFTGFLFAQDQKIVPGWGTLDYAVPESPAFKILGSSPDNLLKPTSVRSAAISVGNYFLTKGSTIPKNLAVEVSPLLLNSKASLNDYNKNKFLYRLRFSLGTNLLNDGSYNVSEGFRFTIFDKTDLRDSKSNPDFTNFLYNSAINQSKAVNKAISQYIVEHPAENLTTVAARTKYSSDADFKKIIDAAATKFYDIAGIVAYRDSIREVLWNARIWELGVAALQSSKDSLVKNLELTQIGVWSTAAFPIGKKGQILIGGSAMFVDSVTWQTNISIGERVYYGSNNVKGFLQAQYEYKNKTNNFDLSFGGQFNITNGLWGDVSLHLVVDGTGKLTYQPGFHIGFGTPEKKKF